nr:hypothetical protein [Tanacetum cinerariifolium]
MQITEEKVDLNKALDASLVITECSRTNIEKQDTSNRSGNDADVDNADIKPVYDKEPMVDMQLTVEFLGKPILHPLRDQSVVKQPTAFKSERPISSKARFASQVDVNNDLSKPVTTHYLPNERESTSAKPHQVIVSSNFRNSLKNMPRFSSNDMVHNHYLEKAKNKTHDI